MNKKVMALAVAGAFAAPAAAFAQASNVQIYGTAYIEYGYAKQGTGAVGQLNNIDELQTPGSNIGFKGEEALGGGLSGWFQCESSLDFRGAGNQATLTANGQNSGILCGRNSALGIKGSFGNIYAGNWDAPMKQYNPQIMGTNETGVLGTSFMLYGSSTSTIDGSAGTVFERRQNNSIMYNTPTWNGFSAAALVSTPGTAATIGLSSNASVGKPRMFGIGLNYTNGPLIILGSYESHSNFAVLNGGFTQKGTTDTGYQLGAAYQFGPVKAGAVYIKRNFDGGCNTITTGCTGDASVSTYGLNVDWAITGPHELKVAYVKANSTSGANMGSAPGAANFVGNLVFNAGAGQTGGSIWEAEYIYNFSKRTRVSFGYVSLSNDANARYSLGGFTAPIAGTSQSAFMTSLKSTF